jgi:hypothetical protein
MTDLADLLRIEEDRSDHLNALANDQFTRSERLRKLQEDASQLSYAIGKHADLRLDDTELLRHLLGVSIVLRGVLRRFDLPDTVAVLDEVNQQFDLAMVRKRGGR